MNNNFTKSDLKDGMVVTYRDGRERTVLGSGLYEKSEAFKYNQVARLKSFKDDLMFQRSSENSNADIMQVSYMGKTLWKRKELYTLKEIYQMAERGEIASTVDVKCQELSNNSMWLTNAWGRITQTNLFNSERAKYVTERIWEIVE